MSLLERGRALVMSLGLGLGLALLCAASARADASSDASHRLFTHLAQARLQLPVGEAQARASSTLVNQLYALSDSQGRALGYFNDAGTLLLDARGAQVLGPDGLRALTPDETAALRLEVMQRIRYEALIKLVYGQGGGRRVLMFSALDCPYCRRFEDTLGFVGDQLNTTFYVVPSALVGIEGDGISTWQKVSRIWCAESPGNAWEGFWSEGSLPAGPAARSCEFAQPQSAVLANQQLRDILKAVGSRVFAVPQFVREDGVVLRSGGQMELRDLDMLFGPKGLPAASVHLSTQGWLSKVSR
ncbi:MAG TPA: hypothetical protein VGM81_00695 [Burkholderiaceae bacterium]|jgi:thiol:disulfide interchange protein DsbC